MLFAGNWLSPTVLGLCAAALLIAWLYRSVRALVVISALAGLALPVTFQIINTEAALADQLSLVGLLTPGFIAALALALGAFLFAPQSLASRRFISALAVMGLLNCAWLADLVWEFSKIERSTKQFLSKMRCPKKQADAGAWIRCETGKI